MKCFLIQMKRQMQLLNSLSWLIKMQLTMFPKLFPKKLYKEVQKQVVLMSHILCLLYHQE